MRHLTRSRKWKHKEGRGTSHSYWSRTHGPRGTTHGTSRRRPWLWMVYRRGSSFRQGAGAASPDSPNLETAARWYRGEFAEKRLILGVSTMRLNIGIGGHRGDRLIQSGQLSSLVTPSGRLDLDSGKFPLAKMLRFRLSPVGLKRYKKVVK